MPSADVDFVMQRACLSDKKRRHGNNGSGALRCRQASPRATLLCFPFITMMHDVGSVAYASCEPGTVVPGVSVASSATASRFFRCRSRVARTHSLWIAALITSSM